MRYNIENELKIRQILESITPFEIEFNQNYSDKFAYDLKCYKHIKNNTETGYEKKFMCFIEVEHGKSWNQKEFPERWELSFLQRKVCFYDYKNKMYLNELKENGKNTIYLKTNLDFTNCYFNKIDFIFRNGTQSKRNTNNRLNNFLILKKEQSNFGWRSFTKYITNYCSI